MKIECILYREGGTFVELSDNYHFAPQADGRHIATVTNERDIDILLAIPEAYMEVEENQDVEIIEAVKEGITDALDKDDWLVDLGVDPNDKESLKKLAKANGVSVKGNPSIDTLKSKLGESLSGD